MLILISKWWERHPLSAVTLGTRGLFYLVYLTGQQWVVLLEGPCARNLSGRVGTQSSHSARFTRRCVLEGPASARGSSHLQRGSASHSISHQTKKRSTLPNY